MNFNEYTKEIVRISKLYSIPEEKKLDVYALGLPGEIGEICELIKKHIRDDRLDEKALVKEIGDVLAYLTLIADSFGFTLGKIAEMSDTQHDPEDTLTIHALRLVSKGGKVSDQLINFFCDGTLDKHLLAKELGGIFAYLTLIADSFGFTLEQIAEMNLEKLTGREEKGTLHGTGNDR